MRYFIGCLLVLAMNWPLSEAVELPSQAQRLMDSFHAVVQEADEELAKEVEKAEAEHRDEINNAVEKTLKGLKRSLRSRSPVEDQIAIYRTILRLNQSDEDAIAFFTSIGTLEEVLADIEPIIEQDFLGNSFVTSRKGSLNQAQAHRLVQDANNLSQEDWNKLEAPITTIPATAQATRIDNLKASQTVLMIAAPDDRWLGGEGQPQVNAIGNQAWPDINGFNMALAQINGEQVISHGLAAIITAPENGLFFGPNDGGLWDNSGSIRIKIILVQ